MERPVSYKEETWKAIAPRLERCSEEQLALLAKRAGIEVEDKSNIIGGLLNRGGFLLVEFGLIRNPDIMVGTIFEYGELEYKINKEAAEMLAVGHGSARVDVIGGGRLHTFSYANLVKALVKSGTFDQL